MVLYHRVVLFLFYYGKTLHYIDMKKNMDGKVENLRNSMTNSRNVWENSRILQKTQGIYQKLNFSEIFFGRDAG